MISFAKRIANVEEYYFSKKLAEVRKLDTPDFPTINLMRPSFWLSTSHAVLLVLQYFERR